VKPTRSLFLGLLVLVGCGSGGGGAGSNVTISDQPLSGVIGGQPWTFGSGETDAFLSTADSFFVNLYPGAVTPCSFGAPTDVNLVTMQVPSTPGSYPISLQRNVTLYVASTSFNNVATRGLMVIDSVTATTVSGGLNTTYDDANHVDGQFQATICP
jgi:hypothetical protein